MNKINNFNKDLLPKDKKRLILLLLEKKGIMKLSEIVKETNLNYTTIQYYIENFIELGVVIKTHIDNKNAYYFNNFYEVRNVEISKEVDLIFNSILGGKN